MAKKNYTFNWSSYALCVLEIDANDLQLLKTEQSLERDYEIDKVWTEDGSLYILFLHHTQHIKRNEVEEIIYKIFK